MGEKDNTHTYYLDSVEPSYYNGPLYLAPISISNESCYKESFFTYYDIDVYVEKDLDFLTLNSHFKTDTGVIVDDKQVIKADLKAGNTYRFQFEVIYDSSISTCSLDSNVLYTPEYPITSTCTGTCTAVNENTTGDLKTISFQTAGLYLGIVIVGIALIGFLVARFDKRN
ncbi:MAG: hypothetical protein KQ78_00814 [Candidatus Izimaplasma bacterium HR2]|nr:MAG: hypothetical protein KQ78_00814 [Candidatus Izimaplasma bacterium HR2]